MRAPTRPRRLPGIGAWNPDRSHARKIALLGHPGRPEARRAAARLAARLETLGCEVRLDDALAAAMKRPGHPLPRLARWCQLLVSLGGDGTALRGAVALARQPGVLLAVNLGGMGFLTVAEEPGLDRAVNTALAGRWPVETRRLLEVTVVRGGKRVRRELAMNDAVVKAAGGYAAIHLQMRALGADLGHLVADGVIAATAAGSTAYSLSAGGPVVSHDLEALVVTPVCPHTIASRSLVLAGGDPLTVRVLDSPDRAGLFLDGQETLPLEPRDTLRVALGQAQVRLFQNPEKPLGRALQSKLGWQGSDRRSKR